MGGKTRIGHAGTLDPFAGGVLVLCVGPATRLAEYVQAQPKRYTAEITLGATSTTDDVEGEIAENPSAAAVTQEAVREALTGFVGEIAQVPPSHSAVHVGGRRAYKLARRGVTLDLPARRVAIHGIELVRYEFPLLVVEISCGSGTYIRSLARDVGAALGVGGYCSRLTRTAVGPFKIEGAALPEQIDPGRDLISPLAALESLTKVTVDEADSRALQAGRAVRAGGELSLPAGDQAAAVTARGELLAIVAVCQDGRTLRPLKVFAQQA